LFKHPELIGPIEELIVRSRDGPLGSSNENRALELLAETLLSKSKSQAKQDLFVLFELGFKRDGFFVEFGATNGVELSNTYILEKHFGWSGILAEPANTWWHDLRNNRHCHIEQVCVWKTSGEQLEFNELEDGSRGLSTINSFSGSDLHASARKNGKLKLVKSISLVDLLDKYDSPREIDYLSIDTEGSEYEILKEFNFNKYIFRVITVEHNYMPARQRLNDLLIGAGYIRKFEAISGVDDWYVYS